MLINVIQYFSTLKEFCYYVLTQSQYSVNKKTVVLSIKTTNVCS